MSKEYEPAESNEDFEVWERKRKRADDEDEAQTQRDAGSAARSSGPSAGPSAGPSSSRGARDAARSADIDDDDDAELFVREQGRATEPEPRGHGSRDHSDDDLYEVYGDPRPDEGEPPAPRPDSGGRSTRPHADRDLASAWFQHTPRSDEPTATPTAPGSAASPEGAETPEPTPSRSTEPSGEPTTDPSAAPEGADAAAGPSAEAGPVLGLGLPEPPARPMTIEDDGAPTGAPVGPPAPPPHDRDLSPHTGTIPIHRSRGTPMRLAIACTEFNYDITRSMLERARAHAEFLGCSVDHVVHVPGVYDLPFAVQRLARRDDVDGVVTLGVVIEGDTDHDDLVIQHAARKIIDLSLEHDKPIGLGITGPGMTRLQAEARIDRAKEAVEAVVKLGRTVAQY